MKKIVFFIAALLIGTVFNFNTEAYATTYTHNNQNTSAFTGYATGHGYTYGYLNVQYNTVAVKKKSNNDPVIPFGTTINLTKSLFLDGANVSRTSFRVTDTGAGTNRSAYWIDVYYGANTIFNNTNANKFGDAKIVSYTANY